MKVAHDNGGDKKTIDCRVNDEVLSMSAAVVAAIDGEDDYDMYKAAINMQTYGGWL